MRIVAVLSLSDAGQEFLRSGHCLSDRVATTTNKASSNFLIHPEVVRRGLFFAGSQMCLMPMAVRAEENSCARLRTALPIVSSRSVGARVRWESRH